MVSKAYRNIASSYHPDKLGEAADEEKEIAVKMFRRAAEARDLLLNVPARAGKEDYNCLEG